MLPAKKFGDHLCQKPTYLFYITHNETDEKLWDFIFFTTYILVNFVILESCKISFKSNHKYRLFEVLMWVSLAEHRLKKKKKPFLSPYYQALLFVPIIFEK